MIIVKLTEDGLMTCVVVVNLMKNAKHVKTGRFISVAYL